jgi:hypothetical protein
VILTTDGTLSYLVFNYERLDQVLMSPSSFINTPIGNSIKFTPSVLGSNCNVPGQFVFRVDDGRKWRTIVFILLLQIIFLDNSAESKLEYLQSFDEMKHTRHM